MAPRIPAKRSAAQKAGSRTRKPQPPTPRGVTHQMPTVGRIVHCYLDADLERPAAGIIVLGNANPKGEVTLAIFTNIATFIRRTLPWSATPAEGHWNWPPRVPDAVEYLNAESAT